jgi:GntR family transcriptional regulator, transcriptional repressor for pyruvate dehydrogenase complex
MFKQAKQNRAFEDIVLQVQEAIFQGSLQIGDRLPGERNLREIFGVSRGTLREALRALEQKGMINIRTGVQGGAIVQPIDTRLVSESLDLLLRYQKVSLRELAEFRAEVEGLVAAMAAQRVKKSDVTNLNTLLESFKGRLVAAEFNWFEIIQEDNRFHLAIARIAGNRVFESVLKTVYDNINRYFVRFLSRERSLMEKNYHDLKKITEAIENKNPQKAQSLVNEHVRYFNNLMEREAANAERGAH